MSLSYDKIPDVCPICGAELGGSLCCPNCDFKVELPFGDVESISQVMDSETAKEPNDYSSALEKRDLPNEDPMLEYSETAQPSSSPA